MRLIAIFSLILAPLLFTSDLDQDKRHDNQRGMTNLLGAETYMRCSQQLQNPNARVMFTKNLMRHL